MANLRGGNFKKQSKDAFHRLEAFSVPRHSKHDNLTHSNHLAKKREMYLRDVSRYFQSKGLNNKLNTLFSKNYLTAFFNHRLANLSEKTQEDYLRGFSSMLMGLEDKNIKIPLHEENKEFFNEKVYLLKNMKKSIIKNRYIQDRISILKQLQEDREISALLAECQYSLSIRVSEAFELIKNPRKYLNNGFIVKLKGKGNHIYDSKEISFKLEKKILNNKNTLISQSTYFLDLKKYNITSHDFRFTAARDKYEHFLKDGISEKEAKFKISRELNHKRSSITDYYLKKTI